MQSILFCYQYKLLAWRGGMVSECSILNSGGVEDLALHGTRLAAAVFRRAASG
jgi:hypothetical protein